MSDISILLERLEALEKENKYLKALEEIAPAKGETFWGKPRAPLTDEERAKFREANSKYKHIAPTKQDNAKLAIAAKITNLQEEILKRKKNLK